MTGPWMLRRGPPLDRAARRSLRDANDLYAYFLLDVEMAPCMMTSRIKQAHCTVQLFVQRVPDEPWSPT